MKKVICLILSVMFSLSLAVPAFAAVFTASVENKQAPEVVEITDEEGNVAVATLIGNLPEGMQLVSGDFLVVTAVADAESSYQIPEVSQQALLEVYTGLQDGSILVPFEQLDEANAPNLVIRDLFDVSWVDVDGNDIGKLLDAEDVFLEMTFDMKVAADAKVYVMVYKNDAWQQIQQVTNNGDGTITCVFEHLCPVAVIVEAEETVETEEIVEAANVVADSGMETSSNGNMTLWIVIMAAALLTFVALLVSRKRKQK